MVLLILPVALVLPAVRPDVDAVSVLLVIQIFSLVLSSVVPSVEADSVVEIHRPLSLINFIREYVDSNPAHCAFVPLALVRYSFSPLVQADASFCSALVLSNVAGSVLLKVSTKSLLLVVFPKAHENRSLGGYVDTVPICSVISPESFIDNPVQLGHFPLPKSLIMLPFTFVFRAIRPDLNAPSMSKTTNPLPLVGTPSLILVDCPFFLRLVEEFFRIINHPPSCLYSLVVLFPREVLGKPYYTLLVLLCVLS